MKKQLPFLIFLVFQVFFLKGLAQQYPQITCFNVMNEFYNPAAIGLEGKINAGTIARKQWVGLEGSPLTISVFGDYTFKNNKSIVGFQSLYDKVGSFTNRSFKFIYSHHFRITRNSGIRFALVPEVWINTTEYNFIAADPNDPAIPPNGKTTGSAFTFSGGVHYYWKKLVVGISSQQILESKFTSFYFLMKRHMMVIASYEFKLNDNFSITPSYLMKTDFNSYQQDGILLGSFKKKYFLGVGYRHLDAVNFQGGIKIKKVNLFYSFDLTTSEIKNYSKGSHEIVFRWVLPKPPIKVKIVKIQDF